MTTWCIPEAIGVPDMWGQPPTWPGLDALNGLPAWQALPSVSYSTPRGLDDPRWQGTLSFGYPSVSPMATPCCTPGTTVATSFGDASNEDVVFRTIYDQAGDQRFLYLSWWVKAGEVGAGPGIVDDSLYVGFTRSSGDPLVLRLDPSVTTGSVSAAPVGAVTLYTLPPGGTTLVDWTASTPSWINANTRVWVDAPSRRWALQMRIPVGAGNVDTHVDLANTFKMWFEVSIELPGGLIAPYSWPRNACVLSECGFLGDPTVPAAALWDDFHFSTGPGDPVCPTTGFVSLASNDIGTQNTPTSQINLISNNVFEAKPLNATGSAINPAEITADFKLADWGSMANPTPWNRIPATGGTSNPVTNPASIANGSKGSITFQWQLSRDERTDYASRWHQCILVELSGPFAFNPASIWRNMDFVAASRFERDATLSNVGLGVSPTPGAPRTAYILVEKLNMPEVVEPDRGGGGRDGDGGEQQRDSADLDKLRNDDRYGALIRAAEKSTDPIDRHEQGPTIRYHVYHDTGQDVTRQGRTLRVVRPGTAFGFFVEHSGPLDGWTDEIHGATRITDRFYTLDIPEEGTARITTVIEAREAALPAGCLRFVNLLPPTWRDALLKFVAWIRGAFRKA